MFFLPGDGLLRSEGLEMRRAGAELEMILRG